MSIHFYSFDDLDDDLANCTFKPQINNHPKVKMERNNSSNDIFDRLYQVGILINI